MGRRADRALAQGLRFARRTTETFEAQTREVQDLRAVIRAPTESQPEFKLAVWDCIARLVDTQRIADGQAVLAAQTAPLQTIAARRGVDAATAVAVFGVETDHGQVEGRYPVVAATLSRACLDLNSKQRKRHFFAALWLLPQGLVQAESFRGSWAGAFCPRASWVAGAASIHLAPDARYPYVHD
ncbi:MAG: lytic murein transglycosylase [Burkholderiales bacterium]